MTHQIRRYDSKEEKMMTDRKELEGAIQNEVERRQFSLMNDELFGYVFGSDERRDITADFLGAALEDSLGHGITGVSFMPPREIPVLRDRELVSRFAARCELGEEDHAFAELQLVNSGMERAPSGLLR